MERVPGNTMRSTKFHSRSFLRLNFSLPMMKGGFIRPLAVAQVSKQHVESISQNYYLTKRPRAPDFGLNAQCGGSLHAIYVGYRRMGSRVSFRLADEIKVDLPATSASVFRCLSRSGHALAWISAEFVFQRTTPLLPPLRNTREQEGTKSPCLKKFGAIQRAKDAGSKSQYTSQQRQAAGIDPADEHRGTIHLFRNESESSYFRYHSK